jgi:hypothetical protein
LNSNPKPKPSFGRASRAGAFASPEEVIERALEFLSVEEEWLAENHDEIAAKVQEGWDAARRGELTDLTQGRANLQRKKEEWLAQRHQP